MGHWSEWCPDRLRKGNHETDGFPPTRSRCWADHPVGDRSLRDRDARRDRRRDRGRLLRVADRGDRPGEGTDADAREAGGEARRDGSARRAAARPRDGCEGRRRRRGGAGAQQLDRPREDLVSRRPGALLRRARGDRRPVLAGRGPAPAAPERRRGGGGHRPESARERARPPGGAAARGLHPDPHAVGHAAAVRDLPAIRLGHVGCTRAPQEARAADPRRDRPHPPRPGAAPLVAHAPPPAQPRAARRTARERRHVVTAGTAASGVVPPRRPGAGAGGARVLAGAGRRRRRETGRRPGRRRRAEGDRSAARDGARPAGAARRPPPADSRDRGARLGAPRPHQPAIGKGAEVELRVDGDDSSIPRRRRSSIASRRRRFAT